MNTELVEINANELRVGDVAHTQGMLVLIESVTHYPEGPAGPVTSGAGVVINLADVHGGTRAFVGEDGRWTIQGNRHRTLTVTRRVAVPDMVVTGRMSRVHHNDIHGAHTEYTTTTYECGCVMWSEIALVDMGQGDHGGDLCRDHMDPDELAWLVAWEAANPVCGRCTRCHPVAAACDPYDLPCVLGDDIYPF